jgi:glucosamine-phosphate N-acetyltransferase
MSEIINQKIREIDNNDYYKGYLELINQLFHLEKMEVTYEHFCDILATIQKQNAFIYVIEDLDTNQIIATGKIIIEQKSHGSKMGNIQDVVTDSNYRKSGNGKKIINQLVEVGKQHGCYKVVLNCNPNNIDFYKKCNFIQKGVEMCLYMI